MLQPNFVHSFAQIRRKNNYTGCSKYPAGGNRSRNMCKVSQIYFGQMTHFTLNLAPFTATLSPPPPHLIRYTYGHPVPGSAKVKMCRPLSRYYASPIIFTPLNPDGIPDIVAPCYEETKKVQLVFQPKSVGTTRPMISLGIRRLETVVGRIRFLTRAFEARIRSCSQYPRALL